jgi:hypothetical protein
MPRVEQAPIELPALLAMSEAEEYETFDRACKRLLGLSGEEFIHRWRAGAFGRPDSVSGVMEALSLVPSHLRYLI